MSIGGELAAAALNSRSICGVGGAFIMGPPPQRADNLGPAPAALPRAAFLASEWRPAAESEGRPVRFGGEPSDKLTDLLAAKALAPSEGSILHRRFALSGADQFDSTPISSANSVLWGRFCISDRVYVLDFQDRIRRPRFSQPQARLEPISRFDPLS